MPSRSAGRSFAGSDECREASKPCSAQNWRRTAARASEKVGEHLRVLTPPCACTMSSRSCAACAPPPLAPLDLAQVDVERLRYLLWNGHHDKVCEALGRIVSWAKEAIVLNEPSVEAKARRLVSRCTELRAYVENNEGALSQDTARLMVFKLVMAAAKTWRRLKGENQLPKVIQGVTFKNGVEVINTPAQSAA